MKANGIINIYCSIIFNYTLKEIRICNDAGRMCRPVLKVDKNKLLLNKKIIEIITINKSGKNGPETKAGGIKISSIDAINNKL